MANEARLIDANGAMEYAQKVFSDPVLLYAIKTVLDNAPTVDAVEVVRCKGCEHYDPLHIRPFLGSCSVWDTVVNESGFCHHGERKTK